MLPLPSSVRIFLAAEPVDLRRGVDGLAGLVRTQGHDAYSGHLYCFGSRRRDRLKILVRDRGGFVLDHKRLEAGRFRWPEVPEGARQIIFDATRLAVLLDGIDVRQAFLLRGVLHSRRDSRFLCDRDKGANLAGLYSLVSTCESCDVDPVAYPCDVLLRIDTHPTSRIDEILPDGWKPPLETQAANSAAA